MSSNKGQLHDNFALGNRRRKPSAASPIGPHRPKWRTRHRSGTLRTLRHSRITVRKALAELKAEGLVTSQRGSGWRATPGAATDPVPVQVKAVSDAKHNTAVEARSEVSCRWVKPPATLSRRYELRRSDHMLRVRLTRRLNGVAFDRNTVWYSKSTGEVIDRQRALAESPARLLQATGFSLGSSQQLVSASSAGGDDTHTLGLRLGDPILVVRRARFLTDGEFAFVSEHCDPAELVEISVDLPTSDNDERTVVISNAHSYGL